MCACCFQLYKFSGRRLKMGLGTNARCRQEKQKLQNLPALFGISWSFFLLVFKGHSVLILVWHTLKSDPLDPGQSFATLVQKAHQKRQTCNKKTLPNSHLKWGIGNSSFLSDGTLFILRSILVVYTCNVDIICIVM